MPELPEVETIVRGLNDYVVGRTIASSKINVEKLFRGDPSQLIGATISDVTRKGKIILIRLDNDMTLAIHLKMTGQLIWLDKDSEKKESNGLIGGHPDKAYSTMPPHKYTHITINFKDGSHLYFNDLRKFGWIHILPTSQEETLTKHLGPDPLIGVEVGYLKEKYKNKKNSLIKTILLDQTILAGLGNIYADETLFCAGVLPWRKVGSLKQKEIEKIAKCIPEILDKSLKAGGTSRSDYRKLDGSKGSYLDQAWVYGREGLPCRICKTPIKRIKIAGRSSHYCETCQK
jgi:formamidopyrimidine-DNA glycosylase